VVNPLDIKLMRDFVRLWTQALAIALVAAAGVMTLLLGVGTHRALSETQLAYYERYSFADVFAIATRAPNAVLERIISIPGVARASARIQQDAVLDIPHVAEPASGLILSIPDIGEAQLNRLYVVEGHLPDLARPGEIAVSQAFALAHDFQLGDTISAIMGGVKRTLTIAGIALSPEFIYSTGAGDIIPDDKRFGVIWMRYSDAASAYDLTGAFNSVTAQLGKEANQAAVIDAIDDILKPYGGRGAYDRSEQLSHAFLDSELTQLEAMSYVLPPIFLGVAAFLVNMILARLVALEREQIGLLKALGYRSWTIAWHYIKLSLMIAAVGTIIGWGLGAWAGRGLAAVYAEFYRFPFLLFQDRPDVFAISGLSALLAAGLGSFQAVQSTVRLSAAVAMAPPAPPVYKQFVLDRVGLTRFMPQGLTMAVRNLARRPTRASLTILGISLSTGLLVSGLFATDSLEYIIDATFFRAERQQASLTFALPVNPTGMEEARRLPGVISAEPSRAVPVSLTNGLREKRGALTGKPAKTDLSRVIDLNLEPVTLPTHGIALSEMMANLLDVRVGDIVEVEILDGREKVMHLPVSLIIQQFMGLGAYMEISALNRALGEGPVANGAHLRFDTSFTDALYSAVKATPAIAGITLQRKSLESFRETIGENIGISQGIYVGLAVLIVFGVVYNSMRIQLSERARELASLRVLGFTRGEVSIILLSELAILTIVAIPFGWILGYGMAMAISEGFQSELFRIPLLINRSTYAYAGLVVLGATVVSAYIVQRRVANLDMIAVLKTRD
jgi:putative ABC transport system permease protein